MKGLPIRWFLGILAGASCDLGVVSGQVEGAGGGSGAPEAPAVDVEEGGFPGSGDLLPPLPRGEPAPEVGVDVNEAACHGDDWIELVVHGASGPVDLSGRAVTDDPGDPSKTYVLPPGSIVPEDGYLVVPRGKDGAPGFGFGIQCGSDTLYVVGPGGVIEHESDVPLVGKGATAGRIPDREGPLGASDPTPGEANRALGAASAPLFDPFSVFEVDLSLPPASLAKLQSEPKVYVPGTATFHVGGVETGPLPAGIRLKGFYGSWQTLEGKAGFKVDLDLYQEGGSFLGLGKITLNNMVQDASAVHESLAYALFREVGVPAPRVGYAWVRLDGEDYGLYAHVETVDDPFLARWFASTRHLYEGPYNVDVRPDQVQEFDVDEGDPDDRSDLEALAAAAIADVPPAVWTAGVAKLTVLAEMQQMWAVEQWTGHWDGYTGNANNYFLHSDGTGRFTMLPWGTDQTFGEPTDPLWATAILSRRCFEDVGCLEGYANALVATSAAVAALDLAAEAKAVAAYLAPWIEADPRRPWSLADHEIVLGATLSLLETRPAQMGAFADCVVGPGADLDQDGFPCAVDCGPDDPSAHPGAEDACGDGVDQDCNGVLDDGPGCPLWIELWKGETRYLVTRTPRTWAEARAECAAEGLDLAVPDEPGEWEWLAGADAAVTWTQRWIGVSDQDVEGAWLTVSGAEPSTVSWADGEPNAWGGDEDCVVVYGNGEWNDAWCEMSNPALCEGE